MKEMHAEYPQLPIMNAAQSTYVCKMANLSPTIVSRFTGVSRHTISALWNGHGAEPMKPVQIALSALAYRSLRALKHKNLPVPSVRNYDAAVEMLLDGARYDRGLHEYQAEELVLASKPADTQRSTINDTSGIL